MVMAVHFLRVHTQRNKLTLLYIEQRNAPWYSYITKPGEVSEAHRSLSYKDSQLSGCIKLKILSIQSHKLKPNLGGLQGAECPEGVTEQLPVCR